jgi:hypothetical protein
MAIDRHRRSTWRPYQRRQDRLAGGPRAGGRWHVDARSSRGGGNQRRHGYLFDPLVLPAGMSPSDDPVLRVRSPVDSQSHTRRAGERKQPSAITPADVRKGESPRRIAFDRHPRPKIHASTEASVHPNKPQRVHIFPFFSLTTSIRRCLMRVRDPGRGQDNVGDAQLRRFSLGLPTGPDDRDVGQVSKPVAAGTAGSPLGAPARMSGLET